MQAAIDDTEAGDRTGPFHFTEITVPTDGEVRTQRSRGFCFVYSALMYALEARNIDRVDFLVERKQKTTHRRQRYFYDEIASLLTERGRDYGVSGTYERLQPAALSPEP